MLKNKSFLNVTTRCNAYAPVSRLLQKSTTVFAINSGYIYIGTQLYVAMYLNAVAVPFLATTMPICLGCLNKLYLLFF